MDNNTTLNFIIKRPAETAKEPETVTSATNVVDDTGDSPSVPYTSAASTSTNNTPTTTTQTPTTTSISTPTTTTAQTTTTIAAPNTGENTRLSFSNSAKSPVSFLPIIFIIFLAVLLVAAAYRHQKSHLKFSKSSFRLGRSPFVLSLSVAGILVTAFLSSSLFSRGNIDNNLNASSESYIALTVDTAIDGEIDDYFDIQDLAYITIAETAVETSSNYDYHLYMRAETDKLYLGGNKDSAYYFNPVSTSGGDLNTQEGTWGYNTVQDYVEQYCDNSTKSDSLKGCDTGKFLPTPTKDVEILKSNVSRNPFLIYFAANPSNGLPDGTYSTKIIYTLVSDEPTGNEPGSPETPDTPDTPDTPSTPVVPSNCVITSTNPCTLRDGRTWILSNDGNTSDWGNLFSDGDGTDGHDATAKSNACPAGYSAPKITDYDALIQAYGGAERTEESGRTGYLATGNNLLFRAFGGETDTIAFWSSTEKDATNAYYFSVSNGAAYSAASHAKITNYYKFACYKAAD